MRPIVALACTALALAALTGCAEGQPPEPEVAASSFDSYLDELRAVEGVESARVDTSSATGTARLNVTVSDTVEVDELVEVGNFAANFADTAEQHQFAPGGTEITRGESTYSYFAGLSDHDRDLQLAYWHDLTETDAERVELTGYTVAQAGIATSQDEDPAETASSPNPRYVRIHLPEGTKAERMQLIRSIEQIRDPGATNGQWDFAGLAPSTRGEYVGPDFPGAPMLRHDAEVGDAFTDVPGLASVEIRRDPDARRPLRIHVYAFDEAIDGVDRDSIQTEFTDSVAYQQLDAVLQKLESDHAESYLLQFVSSPLADGDNFTITLTVDGCTFAGDERWPELSDHFGATWLGHAHPHRFNGAYDECTVNGQPVPRP